MVLLRDYETAGEIASSTGKPWRFRIRRALQSAASERKSTSGWLLNTAARFARLCDGARSSAGQVATRTGREVVIGKLLINRAIVL